MTPVSASYGGDVFGMARSREPVVNGRSDAASLDRRIARPMMAGDEQYDPVPARDRLLQAAVDRIPGRVEVHAVKVEHAIGLNGSAPQLLVPTTVERLVGDRQGFRARR